MSVLKTDVWSNQIKEYRLKERRALLQSISADERLIEQLHTLIQDNADNEPMLQLLDFIRSNAQERRKGMLQLVRDTEKIYGLRANKKR